MKILIWANIEGVAAVMDYATQVDPGGIYFEKARELLTREVNAACQGALENGAREIRVIDAHRGQGIVPHILAAPATLLHGQPFPSFCTLDEHADGLLLLGQYAMAGTEKGHLSHTGKGRIVVGMMLNGRPIGDLGLVATLAGCFKIPVLLVTGDEAACREAGTMVPAIEQAVVKWGLEPSRALSLAPPAAQELIRAQAAQAVRRIAKIAPVKITKPCDLTITYSPAVSIATICNRPGIRRVDANTIGITADNFTDLWPRLRSLI